MYVKSQATLLEATYRGILADAADAFPLSAPEFARDLIRLQTLIKRNEVWFFTMLLPSFGKHLVRCVSNGLFSTFPGPHMRTRSGCKYPRLFGGLTRMIFDDLGVLRVDVDPNPLMFLQQLLLVAKKLRMDCSDETVIATVESFVDVEEAVRSYTLNWGDNVLRHGNRLGISRDQTELSGLKTAILHDLHPGGDTAILPHLRAIERVSDAIVSKFGSPFHRELRPRHGPGAISDRGVNTSKYQFSNWPAKLESCFPFIEFGICNSGYWVQPVNELDKECRFLSTPVPSRLVAVPKTQKGPRLIAAEPVANMWMQQALRTFLEEAVAISPLAQCIDFRSQAESGRMALESSRTKSHSTIDLSDASDRLSCWLVERLFRSNLDLLDSFNAVRTDVLSTQPTGNGKVLDKKAPKLMKLRKFSTQGSALTFPVQTIVYAIICIGVLIQETKRQVNANSIDWAVRQVRLFGDDIIVPTQYTGKVIECLTALGFKVNTTKTFSEGNFRESCGVDGYAGYDITPAYILEPYDSAKPTTVASVVECSNNLHLKGFWHAAAEVLATIPSETRKGLAVVEVDSGAFGINSYVGADVSTHKKRWNRDVQTWEVKVLAVSSEITKTEIRGDFALLQWFTEEPAPETKWVSGEARRPRLTLRSRWVPTETLDRVP